MKKIILLLLIFSTVKTFSQERVQTPLGTFTVDTIIIYDNNNPSGYKTKKIYTENGDELLLPPLFCGNSNVCPIDSIEFMWTKCDPVIVTLRILFLRSNPVFFSFIETCGKYKFLRE